MIKAGSRPEAILPIKTIEALKNMQMGETRSQSVTRRID